MVIDKTIEEIKIFNKKQIKISIIIFIKLKKKQIYRPRMR